jgi:hypothetical protein
MRPQIIAQKKMNKKTTLFSGLLRRRLRRMHLRAIRYGPGMKNHIVASLAAGQGIVAGAQVLRIV